MRSPLAAARGQGLALPQPGLPERDPWALRLFVVVVLVLAVVMAGPRAGHQLTAAFVPDFTRPAGTIPVEAWVKPRLGDVERIRTAVLDMAGSGLTLSKLAVAASLLGDLVKH